MQEKMESDSRRRRWLIAIALFVLAIVLVMAAYAMTRSDGGGGDGRNGGGRYSATSEEAVSQGLATMRELAGTAMAGAIGFSGPDEVARAQPAPAFPVYFVSLNALKTYQAGTPSASLFRELPDSVVPLVVDGQVKSSMTITRSDRGFTATAFGDSARARLAVEARTRGAGDFIVRVPALGFEFIGRRADGQIMLTAMSADPRLRVAQGQAVPAEAVLQLLVPLARAEKGDAPM
jgi:hypothetical protein